MSIHIKVSHLFLVVSSLGIEPRIRLAPPLAACGRNMHVQSHAACQLHRRVTGLKFTDRCVRELVVLVHVGI